jgi:hypothetical protein
MIGDDISNGSKTVLEPTCGNGNFLAEILERRSKKLKHSKLPSDKLQFELIVALSTLYGIDIMPDNIREARKRLEQVIKDAAGRRVVSEEFLSVIREILIVNIIQGDSLKGKKDISIYEFQPNRDNLTFKITKHKLTDIEKCAQNTAYANVGLRQRVINDLRFSLLIKQNVRKITKIKLPKEQESLGLEIMDET